MKADALPFKVGDIVALVPREGSGNGACDGILWRVVHVKRVSTRVERLRVEPCWCATGGTSLRPKTVTSWAVYQRISFARLGELRMQLDDLCREAVAREAGIEPEPTLELCKSPAKPGKVGS